MRRQKPSQRTKEDGSDSRYTTLFHQAPAGLIELSTTGHCLLANERFCQLLGCPRERIEGSSWCALSVPEDNAPGWLACMALLNRERPHLSFEHRFLHREGYAVPTMIHALPFAPPGVGRKAGISSLLLSVHPTEAPPLPTAKAPARSGTQPLQWKERYEPVLLATGQIGYEVNFVADEMHLTGNTGNLLGRGQEITRCQQWIERVHPEERRLVEQVYRSATAGDSYHIEYRILTHEGATATIRDDGCAIVSGQKGNIRLVGVLADVSEQSGLTMQLHHAQKMEIFGRLAGGVAHDFNNLLTVFSGYTDLLMSDFGECDPQREYLEEMQRAAERASALTSQLLAFGRLQRSTPRDFHPGEILMDLRKMLRRVIGEDIEFVINVSENVGLVHADPRQIETVLINLVVNARDAMPHGGRLSIAVANASLRSGDRRVLGTVRPGPYVAVEVRDTGIGIDPVLTTRIFDPFFTTKAPGEGTGLGLATCHSIIEQCGGAMGIESTPGKGSAFRFYLPRLRHSARKNAVRNRKSSPRSRLPRGKGETILLVEDDLAVQKIYSTMLQRLGYTVICGSNGDEALRIAGMHPEICLVITDLVMPLMSGTDLAEELRHILPKAKIVLTSGYASEPADHHDSRRRTPFLPKPLSRDILASTLRELIETA